MRRALCRKKKGGSEMELPVLSSTANPAVRAMRALEDGKARRETDCMRLEGRKLCAEAARELEVTALFVREGRAELYADLIAACAQKGARAYAVSDRVLEYVCAAKTPQDVVLSARIPRLALRGGPLVALDGVQDPGNLGAIVRTCDAAGFGGVVLGPGCADPYAPKSIRATMGSLLRVPMEKVPDLAAWLSARRDEGRALLLTALDGEDFFGRGALPPDPILVIGSEGRGISPAVAACATHRYRLPMAGGAESLNAAVAAGIMIYDLYRVQRQGES